MRIYRGCVEELSSCNACNKGVLMDSGLGLAFPYDAVTVIEVKGSSMRLCDNCLEELKSKI